jgi:hypothetical protein
MRVNDRMTRYHASSTYGARACRIASYDLALGLISMTADLGNATHVVSERGTAGMTAVRPNSCAVPFADVGPAVIPDWMDEEDAVVLTDACPTGYLRWLASANWEKSC